MSQDLTTAFTSGITSIKGDITTLMTSAAPAALAIAGIGIALSFGMNFFRKLAK